MFPDRKFRLCDAMNTWIPALNLLRRKGYKIYIYPDSREEFYGDFWAIKNQRDFIAKDPVALLGLVQIWENSGDSDQWWENSVDDEDILDKLQSIAFPDDPYTDISEVEFAKIIEYLEDFFTALRIDLPKPITKKVLYDFFCHNMDLD